MNDKEKLRHQLIMAKSLVKSNNKKIKKALELINSFELLPDKADPVRELVREIKEILEK